MGAADPMAGTRAETRHSQKLEAGSREPEAAVVASTQYGPQRRWLETLS